MRMGHWRFTLPLRLRSVLRARSAAWRVLGGLKQRQEETRAARRAGWLTDFIDDMQFAFRSLRRSPGVAALVVITLALGIGMTATPFSMLDAMIFRPYPVPNPDDVVTLVSTSRDRPYDSFSYREYLDIRDQTRSYDGVIANGVMSAVGFTAMPGATPRIRAGMMVSGNYFRVLGVTPQVGRAFGDTEDQVPGRDPVVMLGPGFWKDEFAGDPGVVGRTVRLNGTDFTVIGVAPESFPGMQLFSRPDLYVPLGMAQVFTSNPQKRFFEDRDDRELTVRARLASGRSLEAARAELSVLAQDFAREYPALNRDRSAGVHTLFEMRTRDDDVNWKFSVIFAGLALAVLLVACANVAGLLLSRARTRTREIAIRLALGAGRFRLVRLLLAESLVLSGLGGLAGIAVGYAGIEYLQDFTIPAELPVTIPFRMDTRVLLACLAMSVVSAIACGLAPALQSTRGDVVRRLKTSDVDEPGRRQLWSRNTLVVAQVAMSLMLLTAAFLMVRSFRDSAVGGVGFDKDNLLLARFDPRLLQYDAARTARFYRLLPERVRQAPGIRGAGLTQNPPLGLGAFGAVAFVPEGFVMPPGRESFTAAMDTVDEGFFATMAIPMVRGRDFLASDNAGSPRVAVVNERFASRYWPNGDAVGRRIRLDDADRTPVEIVGVAQTIKYGDTTEKPTEFVYLPLAQHPQARMVLMLRTEGDPRQMVEPLKDIVRSLDANLPMLELRTFDDLYRYHVVEGPGVAIRIAGTLGGVGLVLAITGLYGLVAYNVSRRTREIGIRMAIGASRASVLRLMMGKGLVLLAVGTAIGLAMGFAVEQLMNAMLFNAGGVDVVAYLVVVPSMVLVTMIAAYVPARRASRIAPTSALRHE